MQGKIVVYSEETGIGKIITPDHKKYNFSIDEWEAYESMPQVGEEILFTPEGINALEVHPIKEASKRSTPSSVESVVSPFRSVQTQSPPEKTEPKAPKDPHDDSALLEPSVDVETAILIHFEEILKKIEQNQQFTQENRRLDFLRMRRFLTTAYNNLIEIDHSFENYELTEIRQQLMDAYETYKDFRARTDFMENAYRKVFLSKQLRYKELRAKLELNKTQISKLNESARNREEEIREKSKKLRKMDPQSEEAIYLFNEIKILKRTMVDAIHEVAKLTEENRLYIQMLDNFYKIHYERFKQTFSEFVDHYDRMLRKIQDVLAYRFDAQMWKKANRSKPIQNFFAKAGINDEFSAITYLKYYLKTLDTSKLNQQNQELLELLQYLQQRAKIRILCIDEDSDFLALVKEAFAEIDREIKVTLSTRIETTLPDLKNIRPSMLLLDPNMRGLDLDTTIRFARKQIEDLETAFFAKRINRNLLILAKKYNVAAIIPKSLHKQELVEQLRQYLES